MLRLFFFSQIESAGGVVGLSSPLATRPSKSHRSAVLDDRLTPFNVRGKLAGCFLLRSWVSGCVDCSCVGSPDDKTTPLVSPAGKTTAVQEVTSLKTGHVTAPAAEEHVGAMNMRGGALL